MKWYYSVQGGHTHVRVFINGAKCGDLCFRNEEFSGIRIKSDLCGASNKDTENCFIEFLDETPFEQHSIDTFKVVAVSNFSDELVSDSIQEDGLTEESAKLLADKLNSGCDMDSYYFYKVRRSNEPDYKFEI